MPGSQLGFHLCHCENINRGRADALPQVENQFDWGGWQGR